jgi:hypothetical protein
VEVTPNPGFRRTRRESLLGGDAVKWPDTYLRILKQLGTTLGPTPDGELGEIPLLDPSGMPHIDPLPEYQWIYPPVGFLPWPFGEIGNGDDFGYYWPIGRENEDPVVCMMSHDYRALNPLASSLEAAERMGTCPSELPSLLGKDRSDLEGEKQQPDVTTRLALDERSPYLLVANADVAVSHNELERAENLYLQAVNLLPEYTAAHFGLVTAYRRMRRPEQAVRWMVETIRSPACFRGASWWTETHLPIDNVNRQDFHRKCLHWLQQTRPEKAGDFKDDPLFQARHRLTFAEGVTENVDYAIYDEAIEAYVARGQPLIAVRLAMRHGELMMRETTPFRERAGFTLDGFRLRLLRLFRAANLKDRGVILERSSA